MYHQKTSILCPGDPLATVVPLLREEPDEEDEEVDEDEQDDGEDDGDSDGYSE